MRNGLFVVCEGMDAAGKTSSIRYAMDLLAGKDNDMECIYSKGLKSDSAFGRISARFPSTLTLLLELLHQEHSVIRPALEGGAVVIQDRWYYSVLSHNPDNPADRLLKGLICPYLPPPDVLFYFSVSIDERLARLRKGLPNRYHDMMIENPDIICDRETRLRAFYDGFEGSKYLIDTTGKTVSESGNRLEELILGYAKKRV